MRHLLLNAGPIAHMNPRGKKGPLVGAEMSDAQSLIYDPGQAILLDKSSILEIGDSEELQSEYLPELKLSSKIPEVVKVGEMKIWDLAGKAVVPGLIDSHSHIIWAGDRSHEAELREKGYSYRQISEMGGGISLTVRETRASSIEELTKLGLKRLQSAALNGTTFIESKSGYGLTVEDELKLLKVSNHLSEISNVKMTHTWLGAHSIPDGLNKPDYIDQLVNEQLPRVIEQGIAKYVDVFCEEGWFDIEETELICNAATDHGLDIRLHVDEFSDSGGAELAAELGAMSADHAAWSSSNAREKCHRAGVIQGFLPGTPYVLNSEHWPPISECIENEWAWSLASDFNPNCPHISLPFTGMLAVKHSQISPLEALVAVTRNSAESMIEGRGTGLGQIAVGSPASLNILSNDVIDSWCSTNQSQFIETLCNGEWVNR